MSYKISEHKLEQSVLHIPEGVRDIYNGECEQKLSVQESMHRVFKSYGFCDIQTPMFEFFDVFNQERGTIPSREMFKFFDRYGNTMVLRPDITPSIARCFGKYYKEEGLPLRLCYAGNTFINSSSYQGKLKETTQLGAELINDATVDADAEMIALTIDCLKSSGLKEFQIEIGHADFLNGILEEADFDEEETQELKMLIEKKNVFGVEELISEKKLSEDLKTLILKIADMFGDIENIKNAKKLTASKRALKAVDRLEKLYAILDGYGLSGYITFDLGLLSKYNYYTGIIYKAYTYGTGEPIVKGGRYDNLMEQFGKEAPAIGLAIEVDQLMIALRRQKIEPKLEKAGTCILYEKKFRKTAIELAGILRKQGKKVMLIRKSEDFSLEDYIKHVSKFSVGEVLYVDNEDSVPSMEEFIDNESTAK